MNKLFITTALFFSLSSCNSTKENKISKEKEIINSNNLNVEMKDGTDEKYNYATYKGNFVWAGAMNLAWTSLKNDIIKSPIQISENEELVKNMTRNFNNPSFTLNDIDESSYYVKSGYGPLTLATINKEVKAKFPKKSFQDISLNIAKKDIISYAYLTKEIKFKNAFNNREMNFDINKVEGFYGKDTLLKQLELIYYESNDKFIINIKSLEDKEDLLIAKGFDMSSPVVLINFINLTLNKSIPLSNKDEFWMPKINLDFEREYKPFIGIKLLNKGYSDFIFKEMKEKIKFNLDENGAKVENEAVIGVKFGSAFTHKKLFLNKPFWLIMKQKNSLNPYLILGIKNSKFMNLK